VYLLGNAGGVALATGGAASPRIEQLIAAGNSEGALNLGNQPTATFANAIIAGNTGSLYAGVFVAGGQTLRHLTVVANVSDGISLGAGVALSAGTPPARLVNSVLFQNSAPELDGGDPGDISHCLYSGASGPTNVDADPGFRSFGQRAGQWSGAPLFDAERAQTRLQADGAALPDVTGWFVKPSSADPRWAYVAENDADTIWVHGDVSGWTAAGGSYALYDLRLSAASAAIDAADDSEAPATDITVKARHDVPAVGSATADIGAHEWSP
jgi:hypothetical protein